MIKQIMFLRWAKQHRLPVTRDGKLSAYGHRIFTIWQKFSC